MAILTVGTGGTYATIQEAIGIAVAGDTIMVAAGIYAEYVIVDKDVTIQGANAGKAGSDATRGLDETIITGGVKISADGVTLDGVEISGSYDITGVVPGLPVPARTGILIGAANVTVENSVFTGGMPASRPLVATGTATGLDFQHNLVQGWTGGAYLAAGSTGSVTDNTFVDNGSGVFSEGLSFQVTDNDFSGSSGADVGGYTDAANFTVASVIHDNIYSTGPAQPISIQLKGPNGQVVNGSDVATRFDLSSQSGIAIVDGGTGGDTAVFGGSWKDYTVTGTGTFAFVDNRAGSPNGTDVVSDVESFEFADVTATAAQLLNDAPVAVVDSGSATEKGGVSNGSGGSNATGNVLTNDTDADSGLGDTKAVSALAGGTDNGATFSKVGSFGTLTVTKATGEYTYVVANGNATVQALNAASPALTDVFQYTVQDAHGATSAAMLTISVNGANDTPVVVAGGAAAYTEQVAAVVVDSTITISDVDSANLTGATVTITSGLQSGDTLHFTNQNGISLVSYSGGVLTLSGSSSVANYQAALRSVTFDNLTNDNPTAGGATSRTITWAVNDGSGSDNLSPGVTSTINITATNDPTTVPGGNAFPSLSGVPKVGVPLNGAIAALSDPDGLTSNGNPSYNWQSSPNGSTAWSNITPPATSSSFTPTASEAGQYLRVVVTVIDDQSFAQSFFGVSSQPTEAANGQTATVDRSGAILSVDINTPGSTGNWHITTGSGPDHITTGAGNDVVTTGAGNDVVQTNGGNDTVSLGGNDDTFEGGSGAGDDLAIGGAGTDTATYPSTAAGVVIDLNEIDRFSNPAVAALLNNAANQAALTAAGYIAPGGLWAHLPVAIATGSEIGTDVLLSFENATGGSGNDSFTGNSLANTFDGGLGSDTVVFHGSASDGIASQSGATLVVNGSGGGDGTDTLIDIEKIVFQNGTPALATDDLDITVEAGNAILRTLSDSAAAIEAGGSANGTAGTNPTGNVLANDINLDQVAGNATGSDVKRVTAARQIDEINDVPVLSGLTIDGTLVDVAGLYGTLKIAEDGTYQYIVNQAAVDFKNVGDTPLIDTFVYTADDGSGFAQVQVLQITITPVNDAAAFFGQSTGDVTEKGGVANGTPGVASANGDLDATDVDSAATFVVQSSLSKAYGTFSIDVNGVWSYTLDDTSSAVQGLSAGQTLHDQFNVATADGTTKLMDITIHGADDTATITPTSVTTSETNLPSFNFFLVGDKVTIAEVDVDDAAAPHPYVANSGIVSVIGPPPPSDTLADLLSFDPATGAVTYDRSAFNWLPAGQSVEYTISFQARSGNDAPQLKSLTVTINGQNDAPVLTTLTHPVFTTINEHDTNNPGQTVASFRGPISDADSGGSAGIAVTGLDNGNGHWDFKIGVGGVWTPFGAVSNGAALLLRDIDFVRFVPNNASGTSAGLSYRAWDGTSGTVGNTADTTTNGGATAYSTATDTATITVLPVNDPPVATNDTSTSGSAVAATEAGGTLNATAGTNATGNVLTNDTDVDSAPLTVAAIRTGGTEGAGTAGALSVGLAGAHGTLTLNADGSYTYVVNENDGVVQALTASQSTIDSFNYTVRDPGGLTDTALLTITINGANDAPVGLNDTSTSPGAVAATEKGGTVNGSGGNDASGNVLTNDTDIDNPIQVTAVRSGATEGAGAAGAVGGTTAGQHGTLTLGSNGVYTYAVNETDGAVQALKAGESIADSFNYTVSDGGLTDTAVLTVTINGANDAPTATGLTQSLAVTEDTPSAPLGIVVTEVDAGDTITAKLTLSNPSAGSLTTAGGGSYTPGTGVWTITGSLASVNAALAAVTFVPAPNSNAGATIATHIEDAAGAGPANGTITLTVTPVNDAPVAANDTGSATEKGGTLNGSGGNDASGNVLANDTDVDNSLFVSAVRRGGTEGAGAAGTVGGTTTGQHGTLTLGSNGAYSYAVNETDSAVQALKAGETITDRFNYTVSDGALTDIAVLTVTINGANDAPTATGLTQSLTVTEDTASAPLGIVVTDVDAGDTITATLTLSNASAGSLTTAGGGNYTSGTGVWTVTGSLASVNAALASVAFMPAPNSNAGVTIATHIEDAAGAGPANGTITLTVTPVNDAPLAANDTGSATEKGGTLNDSGGNDASGNVLTNDTDVDSALLTVSAVRVGGTEGAGAVGTLGGTTVGAHGTLTIDSTGAYSYAVNETDSAVQALKVGESITDTFNYTVSDGAGQTDTAVLTVTINGANDIATITTTSVSTTETNLPSFNFFLAGDKVTIVEVDSDDAAAPTGYLTNTGSVAPDGPLPPSGTLADLLGFDPVTGAVTYDRSAFNWLPAGECVVYTINFQAQSGDDAPQAKWLTVTIHGENDAPVLTGGTHPALTTINEHDVDNPGQTVASFRGPVSDADSGATKGIAVIGLQDGNGHWEFSTDGGSCWTDFGSVTESTARLLRDSDLVRFVPNDSAPTSASLDYRAWDGTTGEFGCIADATSNGGTTAFSAATDTATITVLPVNDPPLAQDDCAAAVEASGYFNGTPGSPATGHVLANDSDDGGQPALVVSAVRTGAEAGSGLAGLVGGMLVGAHGTLIMNDDGSFTYTVNEDDGIVQALNVCDFTTDTFTYTARDLGNLTDKGELVITIWGRNDNAVITGTIDGTVLEAGGTLNGELNTPTASADLTATDVDNTFDAWQVVAAGADTTSHYGTYAVTADGVWTYTLDNGNATVQALNVGSSLSDSFTLYTEDETPQLITVTINGSNDAPIGVDDNSTSAGATAATEKGGTLNVSGGVNATGDVLINDTDVDDPTASFVVAAYRTDAAEGSGTAADWVGAALVGTHGTLTLLADGSYTYVVNEDDAIVQGLNIGQSTTDSFNYTVQDPGGLTDTAVLTVTIHGANDAPVGVDDTSTSLGATAATEKGGTSNALGGTNASGNVLTSDTDVDNTTPSLVVTAYRTGATEGSGTAAASVGAALVGAHGTLTLGSNGTYSYVVNENDAVVQALNAGQTTTDSFNYRVRDPGGLTDTAVLTITINGANDAPVGVDDSSASAGAVAATEKGGTLNGAGGVNATGNVRSNDTDVDNLTSSLVVSAYRTGATEGSGTAAASVGAALVGAHGALTLLANGSYTYVVNENDALVQGLNVGQFTTDTFNYTLQDLGGLTDTAVLTITINGANDAPVGVNDTSTSPGATAATEKGGTLNGSGGANATGNVLSNDTDVDNLAALLLVQSFRSGASEGFGAVGVVGGAGVAGAHGTLTLLANGQYTYVVNENDATVQALNDGQSTTDSFNYTVTDGVAIDTAVLTITINGANDAPVGVNDTSTSAGAIAATEKSGSLNGTAGANATGNVRTNDTDVDNTNLSLLVTEVRTGDAEGTGFAGTLGVGLVGLHGTLTLQADGSYSYVVNDADTEVQGLNVGATITDSFNYTIRDPGGLTDFAVLTITIKGANDAAVITGPVTGSVTEAGGVLNGTPNTPTASGNLDSADFDDTSDTWQTVAGAASSNGYGTFAMTAAGQWTYTLNNNLAAVQALTASTALSDSFTVNTVDGTAQVVSITINGANDQPVVSGPVALLAAKEDSDRLITAAELLANTTDVDAGATLAVTDLVLVGSGTLTNNLNGTWTFKPAPDDDTSVSFTYKVGDSIAAAISTSATMDITPVNDTPVSQAGIAAGNEDSTIAGALTATDVEGQALTYALVTDAANGVATVNPNGTYTYKPNANFNGADSFTYSASDGATASVATVNVQIGGVNDAPVNLIPGSLSVEGGIDIPLAGLSISDLDAGAGTMTTTLSVTHGKLSAGALGGVQVAGGGTASVTLTGTLAQINTALGSQNVIYHTDASFAGSDTLTIATSDNGNTGSGGALGDTDQVALASVHFTGSAGDDSYAALPGYERIDAGGGIDNIAFNFKLTDATFTWSGNEVIVTTATSRTVLTGFETFQFADGTVNNNDGDVLVDDLYYYASNRDVWSARVDADAHYHNTGWHEWRDPSAFFSTSFYLAVNTDVKASGADPLIHFHNTGWTQGRQPSMTFYVEGYLKANPDIAAAHVEPLAHFLQFGAGEGRQPVALTELLAENGFDYVYYLKNNPDVAAAHIDPFQHFQTVGWKEGRNPNALFDTKGYLATYIDVAAAKLNPLDHYHQFGWKEGRDPSVGFDTSSYRFAYPDIAAANTDPLKHFLDFGIHEGRSPHGDGVWG